MYCTLFITTTLVRYTVRKLKVYSTGIPPAINIVKVLRGDLLCFFSLCEPFLNDDAANGSFEETVSRDFYSFFYQTFLPGRSALGMP
jgi:hypothetical protein